MTSDLISKGLFSLKAVALLITGDKRSGPNLLNQAVGDNVCSGGFCGHERVVQVPEDARFNGCVFPILNNSIL